MLELFSEGRLFKVIPYVIVHGILSQTIQKEKFWFPDLQTKTPYLLCPDFYNLFLFLQETSSHAKQMN